MPRPPKPESEKYRSPVLGLRLPGDLKERLEVVAAAQGKNATEFVLPLIERAVKRAELSSRD